MPSIFDSIINTGGTTKTTKTTKGKTYKPSALETLYEKRKNDAAKKEAELEKHSTINVDFKNPKGPSVDINPPTVNKPTNSSAINIGTTKKRPTPTQAMPTSQPRKKASADFNPDTFIRNVQGDLPEIKPAKQPEAVIKQWNPTFIERAKMNLNNVAEKAKAFAYGVGDRLGATALTTLSENILYKWSKQNNGMFPEGYSHEGDVHNAFKENYDSLKKQGYSETKINQAKDKLLKEARAKDEDRNFRFFENKGNDYKFDDATNIAKTAGEMAGDVAGFIATNGIVGAGLKSLGIAKNASPFIQKAIQNIATGKAYGTGQALAHGSDLAEANDEGNKSAVFMGVGGAAADVFGAAGTSLLKSAPSALRNSFVADIALKLGRGATFGASGTTATIPMYDKENRPDMNEVIKQAGIMALFEAIPGVFTTIKTSKNVGEILKNNVNTFRNEMANDYVKAKMSKDPAESIDIYNNIIRQTEDSIGALEQNRFIGQGKMVKEAKLLLEKLKEGVSKERDILSVNKIEAGPETQQPMSRTNSASSKPLMIGDGGVAESIQARLYSKADSTSSQVGEINTDEIGASQNKVQLKRTVPNTYEELVSHLNESGISTDEIISEVKSKIHDIENNHLEFLKSANRGTTKAQQTKGYIKNEYGTTVKEYNVGGDNEPWYSESFQKLGRKPTVEELKGMVEDHLTYGVDTLSGQAPPNEEYLKLKTELSQLERIKEGKAATFKPVETIPSQEAAATIIPPSAEVMEVINHIHQSGLSVDNYLEDIQSQLSVLKSRKSRRYKDLQQTLELVKEAADYVTVHGGNNTNMAEKSQNEPISSQKTAESTQISENNLNTGEVISSGENIDPISNQVERGLLGGNGNKEVGNSSKSNAKGSSEKPTEIKSEEHFNKIVKTIRESGNPEFKAEMQSASTTAQKNMVEIMDKLGIKTVFYKADGEAPRGFFNDAKSDTVYVRSTDNSKEMIFALGHEFLHTIKVNHPELYKQLAQFGKGRFTASEKAAFLDTYKDFPAEYDRLSKDEDALIEEMLGDQSGNNFLNKNFWQGIYDHSKELFEKLVKIANELLDKIKGKYETHVARDTAAEFTRDFRKIVDEIAGKVDAAKKEKLSTTEKSELSTESTDLSTESTKLSTRGLKEYYEKNLVAIHNISYEKLEKAIELGGLPVPSIAVTKDDIPFTSFGEITLVGYKDMIDPEVSSTNKVFNTDVYSRRMPTQLEEVKNKEMWSIMDRFRQSFDDAGSYHYNVQQHIENGNLDEAVKRIAEYPGTKLQYLREIGKDIKIPMKSEDLHLNYTESMKSQIKQFAKDNPEMLDVDKYYENENALKPKIDELIKSLVKQEMESKYPDIDVETVKQLAWGRLRGLGYFRGDKSSRFTKTDEEFNPLVDAQLGAHAIDKIKSDMARILKPKKVVDTNKVVSIVNAKLSSPKAQKEYKSWLRDTLEPAFGKKYFKDKNKKFDWNINNVFEYMAGRIKGEENFFTGPGTAKAKGAKKFNSIAEMHKNEQYIAPESTVDEFKSKFEEFNSPVLNGIVKYNKYPDGFEVFNDYYEAMGDYLAGKGSAANVLSRHDFKNVPTAILENFQEASDMLKNAPVQYFEAKPQRIIRIRDFKAAIVPSKIDKSIVNKLKDAGVKVISYEKGDNSDENWLAALSKTKKIPDTRFSQRKMKDEIEYPLDSKDNWWGEGNYKAEGGRLVEMTPDEFLFKAKPLETPMSELTRENVDELKDHIQSGKKLDPLTLYRNDPTDVKASDGRHRAIAAKELGITKVPVIDYTPEIKSTTETPAFKKWFGKSKVKDENGKPLVVYHGTGDLFDTFDKNLSGSYTGAESAKDGFFFSDNINVSETYRQGTYDAKPLIKYLESLPSSELEKINEICENTTGYYLLDWHDETKLDYEAVNNMVQDYDKTEDLNRFSDFVKEVNQRTWNDPMNPELWKKVVESEKNGHGNIIQTYLKMENPYIVEPEIGSQYFEEGFYSEAIKKAKENGNDGVIFKDVDDSIQAFDDKMGGPLANVYMVFEPTQIKSATGNNGEFDPNNPSMLKSIRKMEEDNPKTYTSNKDLKEVTLNATFIPGSKQFIDADLKPFMETTAATLVNTWKGFVHLFVPKTDVPVAAMDSIMQMKGISDQKIAELDLQMNGIKQIFNRMPEIARIDFIDRYKKGIPQLTPEMQKIADFYKAADEEMYNAIKEYKPSLAYKENHFRVFWKVIPGAPAEKKGFKGLSKRSMQGTMGFMKQATLKDISEGIDKGGVPITTNPQKLFELGQIDSLKYVATQRMWKKIKELKFAKFVRKGKQAPDDWVPLNDRLSKVYLDPNIQIEESFDAKLDEDLNRFAKSLGIKHIRKVKIGHGKGTWGYSVKDGSMIMTKFGGSETILSHEIGHVLDDRYGLTEKLKKANDIKISHNVLEQLRKLAELRYAGQYPDEAYKKYVRQGAEMSANLVHAYIHNRELLHKTAPLAEDVLDNIIISNPELLPLRDIQPSLVLGSRQATINAGGPVEGGTWYVEPNVARVLNNFVSPDRIRATDAGKALMGIKNMTTAMELAISPFHLVFETLEAMSSQMGVGFLKIYNQGLLQGNMKALASGISDVVTSPLAFVSSYKSGSKAIKYIANKKEFIQTAGGQKFISQYPEVDKIIDDLFVGGGKLKMHEDYRMDTVVTFMDAAKDGNYIGAMLRLLPTINQSLMKPLFDVYIPRLKIGLFFKEYSQQLEQYQVDINSGNVTRETIASKTWDRVENRFGEMNFDNLFWDRTFKTSLQFLMRSVTWKLGNIRGMGGAIKGQSENFKDIIKFVEKENGKKRPSLKAPRLDPNMAWALGLMVLTATISSIIMKTFSGEYPSELKDYVFPRTGEKDQNGNEIRLSMPTYFKDIMAVAKEPIKYVTSSTSGIFSRTIESWNNKDYFGNYIYDPEDPQYKKVLEVLKHEVVLPFIVTTFAEMNKSDASTSLKALSLFGFNKAPRDYIVSDFQKELQDAYSKQMGPNAAKTPAEQLTAEKKKELKQKIADGTMTSNELAQALKEGVVKPSVASLKTLIKNADLNSMQVMWKYLDKDEKKRLIPLASKDEIRQLIDIYTSKK